VDKQTQELIDSRIHDVISEALPKAIDAQLGKLVRKNLKYFWTLVSCFLTLTSAVVGWEYKQQAAISNVSTKVNQIDQFGGQALTTYKQDQLKAAAGINTKLNNVDANLVRLCTKLNVTPIRSTLNNDRGE